MPFCCWQRLHFEIRPTFRSTFPFQYVLVSGGFGPAPLSSSELFSLRALTWSPGPSMPHPRAGGVTVPSPDGDGKLLAVGGSLEEGPAAKTVLRYIKCIRCTVHSECNSTHYVTRFEFPTHHSICLFTCGRRPAGLLVTPVVVVLVVAVVGNNFLHGLTREPMYGLKNSKQNPIFCHFVLFISKAHVWF